LTGLAWWLMAAMEEWLMAKQYSNIAWVTIGGVNPVGSKFQHLKI